MCWRFHYPLIQLLLYNMKFNILLGSQQQMSNTDWKQNLYLVGNCMYVQILARVKIILHLCLNIYMLSVRLITLLQLLG